MHQKASTLLQALCVNRSDKKRLSEISAKTGIPVEAIVFWDKSSLLPSASELECLCLACGASVNAVKLEMGVVDPALLELLSQNAEAIARILPEHASAIAAGPRIEPQLKTEYGMLYHAPCLDVMRQLKGASFQLIFADPPFNLDKDYPSKMDDKRNDEDYLHWC